MVQRALIRAWVGDASDPVAVARRVSCFPGFVWLDGDGTSPWGSRSYLAFEPVETRFGASALEALKGLPAEDISTDSESGPPVPRWVLAWGFDARFGPLTERSAGADPGSAIAFRYDAVLVWEENQFRIVADDEAALERMEARLQTPEKRVRAVVGPIETDPPADHEKAIRQALDLIAQGEIYQVNLARVWRGKFAGDPLALFLAMREASPVPFGFYFDTGARQLCVRTMEVFLQWERCSRRVLSRPIKGTVDSAAEDPAAILHADPKERAEHAMIVDLIRNDLGRVSDVGTVEVEALFGIEPYKGLLHMVSTVTARTQREVTYDRLLQATFPPGSVTGCPKERAIEVIRALEAHPRGFYTGAIGYVSRGGDLLLAVSIRLAEVADGKVRYFAGGGIVSASDPAKEVRETEIKAQVFLDAVDALGSANGKEQKTLA